MKIGINAITNMRDVVEHTKNVTLGVLSTSTHVLWDMPRQIPEELLALGHINNCVAASKLYRDINLFREFKKTYGFVADAPTFYLYGFFNGESFGDILEIAAAHRFLAGDVGQQLGFVQGCGLTPDTSPSEAVSNWDSARQALSDIKYSGEVLLAVSSTFQICDISLGHHSLAFSLLCELGKQHPQNCIEFAGGEVESYSLHGDRIAVSTLLSYPPFPHSLNEPYAILAPTGAEKHLYRFQLGSCEVAYASCWGTSIQEAKRRCRKTIEGCKNYYDNLQYRIDFGWKDRFSLSTEKYVKMGGTLG